jgi:hypothetical protein
MLQTTAKYTLDQLRELGEDILHRVVEPNARPEEDGLFVAINVDTGEYVIDPTLDAAIDRQLACDPDAYLWLARIGRKGTHEWPRRP